MSRFYPDSGGIYPQTHMAFAAPGLPQTPMPDKWEQYRGPLDPTNSPSSSFSPTLSQTSSPRSPQGSPTVTRQLNKFSNLALSNGQSIPSGILPQPTGSPLHQSGRNNTPHLDNLPILGPSFTRRSQVLSIDSSQSASAHLSTVVPTAAGRTDKQGLEYRRAPIGPRSHGSNQPTYSTPPSSMHSMLSEDQRFYDSYVLPPHFDLDIFNFDPTPDITIPDDASTDGGLSAVNNQAFVVNFFSQPLAVPPFGSDFVPLTQPHVGQPDGYPQQALSASAEPIAGGSGSKHADSKAKLLKFCFENFKHSQSFLRVCDQQFKAKVGSLKTSRASLEKRKDDGQWSCPLGCGDFTRKQNLKLHIQSHFGIKDCECICGSTFNAHSGLKRHQKKCRDFLSPVPDAN